IPAAYSDRLIIAYEPVWAIGTGKTATPQDAQDAHAQIRQLIERLYGRDIAQRLRIIYGGSLKPDVATDIFSQPDVDGGLVVDVLGAEADGRAAVAQDGADGEEVREGREDGDLDAVGVQQAVGDRTGEVRARGAVGVHLPVAADEGFPIGHALRVRAAEGRAGG
ncbi:MAG TPA: triose-phosphate isomerase, partial [Dehalococcoidia bacterium]|nr:triose-phosphate isomerase [Dehalococcoidia bacterium]